MSRMSSNPYANLTRNAGPTTPEASATLALAFEQRTANLIEFAKVADSETSELLWVDHIVPRLGLDKR